MLPGNLNLVVLFHRIGPYHFARLRALGRRMPTVAIEFSREDSTYAWSEVKGEDGFQRITLFQEGDSNSHPKAEVVRRVQKALEQSQPLAVAVPGWSSTEAFAAIEWCNIHRVPVISMSESTEWDEKRVWHKEYIKARIVSLASSGLVGGTPHAEYISKLGIPRSRIFCGYDVVDNDYFTAKAAEVRSQPPAAGILLSSPFFLASARFVAKKNLSRLIEAYARYRQVAEESATGIRRIETAVQLPATSNQPATAPWDLVLLGDGPLRPALSSQISTLNLHPYVQMPGFKQYDELPLYYGRASVFIHASTTEQWGLVVNEAMASELPVLVSNRCGCAADLVKEGVNGFTFDPLNVGQMVEVMLKISDIRFPISDFRAASKEIISQWNLNRFAAGMSEAVKAAVMNLPPRIGLIDRLLLQALACK
jgi:1,2-diacylglycerol 3-alpha-glucosyltransferase